jgi:hypothetical protein
MHAHQPFRPLRPLLAALATGIAMAQTIDGVPREHTMRIPPGGLVDLDTGVVLPAQAVAPLHADLRFDRDGRGFFVAPLHGAAPCRDGDRTPADEWSADRLRLPARDQRPCTAFLRTDRGAVARLMLAVVDPYSTASAVLRWTLAPPAMPVFVPAPTGLRAAWRDRRLRLEWQDDAPGWLIEVESGEETRKSTVNAPHAELADLDPERVHRIRVRGLHPGGVVSLPAEVTQHGRRRAAERFEVRYADRWYDATGGLSLSRREPADEDAEVVFYLYGVYVPGGGVAKLGNGGDVYRGCATLPEDGYLPAYARLDDNDVLAVRLADGRFAKLWLVPLDGGDLRSGMVVHATFLPDGRRHMVPTPAGLRFEAKPGGLQVAWDAVQDAVRYRVQLAGERPREAPTPEIQLAGLGRNRFHGIEVTALTADGEESAALHGEVHTFDQGFRVGHCTLQAQQAGYRFTDERTVADGFDLRIESSAGGASYLRFATPHGAARIDGAPFGELDAPAAGFRDTIEFDDRKPGTELFVVRTGEGSVASVRIGQRDYPRIEIDYVLRLPAR